MLWDSIYFLFSWLSQYLESQKKICVAGVPIFRIGNVSDELQHKIALSKTHAFSVSYTVLEYRLIIELLKLK